MAGKIANNYGSFPVVFKQGQGVYLFDENNKKYVDFVSGIGVNCLGHNHPTLVSAIQKQIEKQIHISNYYNSDVGLAFSDKLLEVSGMSGVFFGNSGAEANEAAIKLARKYGYLQTQKAKEQGKNVPVRNVIVTLEKSFHGRTLSTLRATGQDKFHTPCFAPYPEGFRHVVAHEEDITSFLDDSVCAVLIECVQGEGGVNLIDSEWAKKVEKAAHDCGALFMVDEVQTGMGRTGSLFAFQLLGLNPDVVTLAKGIAGGVPMGACLFGHNASDVFVAGDHQSTFGGNPLACAAGLAVLSEMTKPSFCESVAQVGLYIRDTIASWKLPCVKDVRGRGLMIGIDITQSAGNIQKECLENGLCVSTAGANTIRFLPPLILTQKEADEGLAIFKALLEK